MKWNLKVKIVDKTKDMSFKIFSILSFSIFNFLILFACTQKNTNGKTLVVDVRTELEWKQGHGSGKNIPLSELEKHKSELLNYDTVIFVCEQGERAQNAASYMNGQKEHQTIFKNGVSWTKFQER